ncbi:MAG: hypothetical protein GY795_26030 [Desulfobacterales bacterium]|nr:hypothetical protein [Desulfobacterales bacterium]
MTVSQIYAEKNGFADSYPSVQHDEISVLTEEEIISQISRYEKMFGMSSEEFLRQKQNGNEDDSFETMDWMILLRCLRRSS